MGGASMAVVKLPDEHADLLKPVRVCAWCARLLDDDNHATGTTEDVGQLVAAKAHITHGMCLECAARMVS